MRSFAPAPSEAAKRLKERFTASTTRSRHFLCPFSRSLGGLNSAFSSPYTLTSFDNGRISKQRFRQFSSEESGLNKSSLYSNMKFQDVPTINKESKDAITKVLKLEYMTDIQSKTFDVASKGQDVLGRARTGTGKTIAFLLPALERILTGGDKYDECTYDPGNNIGVLVISPTRELAIQIGTEAKKLLTFHKGLSSHVMYGGTKMSRDIKSLNHGLPSILVATPGRLLAHLQNTQLSNGKFFGNDIMRKTGVLVLDETDRLLDMGFRRDIDRIMTYLPQQEKRQTLLFSATVPNELKKIMSDNMKEDFIEVDCIGNETNSEESEQHTHVFVNQTYAVLPDMDSLLTAVLQVVRLYKEQESNSKIMVFFPTARMVEYFAKFFSVGLGIEVIEIHSRKSQNYRTRASEKFRKSKGNVIMFTSDVSARGVDYPDVTAVVQVGLPESREQYIHRLGRTGRAGKTGEGLLLLAPFEEKFVSTQLKELNITRNEEASNLISSVDAKTMKSVDSVMHHQIKSGHNPSFTLSAYQCYTAFIGYYAGKMKQTSFRSKDELVHVAKVFGWEHGLTKRLVRKIGLTGVKNLQIIDESRINSLRKIVDSRRRGR